MYSLKRYKNAIYIVSLTITTKIKEEEFPENFCSIKLNAFDAHD